MTGYCQVHHCRGGDGGLCGGGAGRTHWRQRHVDWVGHVRSQVTTLHTTLETCLWYDLLLLMTRYREICVDLAGPAGGVSESWCCLMDSSSSNTNQQVNLASCSRAIVPVSEIIC